MTGRIRFIGKSVQSFQGHFPSSVWRSPFTYGIIGISVVLNIATWLALLRYSNPAEIFVPLHYTISIGVDRIGQWSELFIMPGIAAGVLVINTLFAWIAWPQPLLSKALHIGTLLVQILVAISTAFLLFQFF
jgi:hypothetical protein